MRIEFKNKDKSYYINGVKIDNDALRSENLSHYFIDRKEHLDFLIGLYADFSRSNEQHRIKDLPLILKDIMKLGCIKDKYIFVSNRTNKMIIKSINANRYEAMLRKILSENRIIKAKKLKLLKGE
ncbi:hypothetical protein JG677_07505 [Campylobacter sp. TTU-622]|uniref:hypothetical protein n=1 Tax=Campylobacter sp. TTU-622 TaxID=2800583 RepID=UPI0017FADDFF|nr:hypothetical protein [Campylobacter sp. TTU-622]EAI8568542.1 hypothetical protein [Campylobacter jejuni]EFS0701716.1 hypothetical protein [Campylobacter jejuni]EHS1057276.1 hypothetical protein [Campylobacter jejuni]EHS1059161.1 hypothetical protein [Campylobacter jejuni]EHS1060912.1 hypothetical protein [Campylobacter jejuni]